MQKGLKITLAIILSIFTIPFGGITILAEDEKVYDDIKDGEYEIRVEALEVNSDKKSAADGFLMDTAILKIDGDIIKLEINYTKDFDMEYGINWAKVEGNDPISQYEKEKALSYIFKINEIKEVYAASMDYYVPDLPPMANGHEVDYRIVLDKEILDNLPVVEEVEEEPEQSEEEGKGESENSDEGPDESEKPEYEPAIDERVVDSVISESDAEVVYQLEYETDSRATAGQLENPVKLLVKNDKKYIQITINEGGADYFKSLKFNGEEVIWNSIKEAPYTIQYEIENSIEDEIDVSMVIQAGPNAMPHDDIKLWFDVDTLKVTKVKDKRVTGDILNVNEADSVQLYDFDTDSNATAGQLKNPIKILTKGNEKYLQIEINEGGAQFFKSLAFNDEEVIWNNLNKAPYIIQYKLDPDHLPLNENDAIDVSMIIDTGRMIMPHDGIKLWIDNTVNVVELGEETKVGENNRIIIGETGESIKSLSELPDNVIVKVKSDKEHIEKYGNKYAEEQDLEIAGEVYDFDFKGINFDNGKDYNFELVMKYDPKIFSTKNHIIDIYYFDAAEQKWIPQNADVDERNGTLTVKVSHFSTYGVFAQKKADDPVDDPIEVPKNAEEIDYVILHQDGKEISIADSFFVKPGLLFEKDGKVYIQVKVNEGDMIEKLSSEYGEAVIVNENKDGSIDVQFQINDDKSDTELQMRIVVPGMYDSEHDTIFSINREASSDPSKKPEPEKKPGQKPKDEKTTTEKPGNVYAIDYIVKHETEDQVSAADSFFVKPGHILEKDGKRYLQVTISNWNFINTLKYDGKDVLVAKINKDGSALVQLLLGDEIPDVINLLINLTVPGVYENQDHTARLVLNPDSMQEVDVDDHVIYTTPVKPEFGQGGKTPIEKSGTESIKGDKAGNPQTGDTSKIFLYTMLLIGSLIPLGIQLRRRFSRA